MAKGTSRDDVMLNSEEIKPIALAVIELRLSEDISQIIIQIASQIVSQLVEKFDKYEILKKIHNNLMQRFGVDLKTFVGLDMPNHAMLPCDHKVNSRLVCRWDFQARNPKP